MIPNTCNGIECQIPLPHEHDDGECFFCVECFRQVTKLCDDDSVHPFRKPGDGRPVVPIQERS